MQTTSSEVINTINIFNQICLSYVLLRNSRINQHTHVRSNKTIDRYYYNELKLSL